MEDHSLGTSGIHAESPLETVKSEHWNPRTDVVILSAGEDNVELVMDTSSGTRTVELHGEEVAEKHVVDLDSMVPNRHPSGGAEKPATNGDITIGSDV